MALLSVIGQLLVEGYRNLPVKFGVEFLKSTEHISSLEHDFATSTVDLDGNSFWSWSLSSPSTWTIKSTVSWPMVVSVERTTRVETARHWQLDLDGLKLNGIDVKSSELVDHYLVQPRVHHRLSVPSAPPCSRSPRKTLSSAFKSRSFLCCCPL